MSNNNNDRAFASSYEDKLFLLRNPVQRYGKNTKLKTISKFFNIHSPIFVVTNKDFESTRLKARYSAYTVYKIRCEMWVVNKEEIRNIYYNMSSGF